MSAAEKISHQAKEALRVRTLRENQTPAAAAARKEADRKQHQQKYENDMLSESHKHVYSVSELEEIDACLDFGLKSQPDILYRKCADRLSFDNMTKHCCVVCECNWLKSRLQYKKISSEYVSLQVKASRRNSLDPLLVSQYDVSRYDPKLAGLFLSQYGFYYLAYNLYHPVRLQDDQLLSETMPGQHVVVPQDDLFLAICPDCYSSTRPKSHKMPADAIANENWIGRLPETFGEISRTTENVVSLMQPCIYLSSLFGFDSAENHRKMIKSHHYVLKNSKPVLRHVPADIGSTLRFTFVGAWTSAEMAEQKTRYQAQDCVWDLLEFLEEHHLAYKKHEELVNSTPPDSGFGEVFADRSLNSDSPVNEKLCRLMQNSSYNTGTASSAAEESTIHYVQSPSTPEFHSSSASTNPTTEPTEDYAVFRSTTISKTRNLHDSPMYFPTAMPFGEGGPAADRSVHLSVLRWILRCCRLYGGVFACHWGFLELCYDYIATNQAFSQQYLSMRVKKSVIADGNWTKEDVQTCFDHSRKMEDHLKRGLTLPEAPPVVKRLLDVKKSVLPGLRAFIGSDESRQGALHNAFGLQKRLGAPNVFITISPATSQSWAVAINSLPT
ncbi:hypothetical protein BDR26DRAFT_960630 [Obelidium mucronatum]|nr:hypothetical protein BDR26DRAFT_960630 [Obelidium mucronatum]